MKNSLQNGPMTDSKSAELKQNKGPVMRSSSTLNSILSRWLAPGPGRPTGPDCGACTRVTKCCDFQPFVANFLLGALLEQGHVLPEGDGFLKTSLGLVASAQFRRAHAAGRAGLACAFYLEGRCSIWDLRPGECSTYLCDDVTPARSKLSARAFALETALAQMALAMDGFSPRKIARQVDILNDPGGGRSEPNVVPIYLRAWAWAQTLSFDDVAPYLEEA